MEEERTQAEFNMSMSYLGWLVESFWRIKEYRRAYSAKGWFDELLILYDGLSTEMKVKEREEWDKEISKLNKRALEQSPQTIEPDFFEQLRKFEIFLRKITKDSGLLMQIKETYDIRGL